MAVEGGAGRSRGRLKSGAGAGSWAEEEQRAELTDGRAVAGESVVAGIAALRRAGWWRQRRAISIQ